MPHLTLDSVSISTPRERPLFSDLSLSIDRDVVGVVGRNGSGKTTLLNAIVGAAPYAGSITVDGCIGLFRQTSCAPNATLAEELGIQNALVRLDRIERGTAMPDDFDLADWTLLPRLEAVFDQLGMVMPDLDRAMPTLSGGERTRVKLAGVLVRQPDILLLDEPTNDLDEAGRNAIAGLIEDWRGPMMIVTHDRWSLERVDRIVELTPARPLIVGGGWSAFKAQREARRAQAQSALERAQGELNAARRTRQRETEKQARRDKRGRAVAASGSAPKLVLNARKERAEHTSARYGAVGQKAIENATSALLAAQNEVEREVPISIELPPTGVLPHHELISCNNLLCQQEDKVLFGPLSFSIRGPERIAVTGPNGSGKTSLIRRLLGDTPPASGKVFADRQHIAVFDQHLGMLDPTENLLEAMERQNPEMDHHTAHAALARFGFRGNWAERLIGSLSGGERVRLALACLFSRPEPPRLLVLDEPTNHLDIEAMEQLEAALRDYDGAILCISHDTAFRQALGITRQIEMEKL